MRFGGLRAVGAALLAACALFAPADTYQWPRVGGPNGEKLVFHRAGISEVDFQQIATGESHSVSVAADGSVFTWGDDNTQGQLGRASDSSGQPLPLLEWFDADGLTLLERPVIAKIGAGSTFGLALSNNGNVFWWGTLGGATASRPRRLVLPTTPHQQYAMDIAAGGGHALMVTNRTNGADRFRVYAWGDNGDGQCGLDPSTPLISAPVEIEFFMNKDGAPRSLACGTGHSVVVDFEGNVFSFGKNDVGQLGTGSTLSTHEPTSVLDQAGVPLSGVDRATAGFDHTVLLRGGVMLTAGGNSHGQLGRNAGLGNRFGETQAQGQISQLSAGYRFNLAVDTLGTLYSWGFLIRANDYAEIRPTPMEQPGLSGVTAICAGSRVIQEASDYVGQLAERTGGFSCAVATDTTPLFSRRFVLDADKNQVQWLTGGASGYLRLTVDQEVTEPDGLPITLESTDPSLSIAPGLLRIPEGSSCIDVPISSFVVAEVTSATFTVAQCSTWVLPNRIVLLKPPRPIRISVTNADETLMVVKGGQAHITLELDYPAPSPGLTFYIKSGNQDLMPSAEITVPAGEVSAATTVNVRAVSNPRNVLMAVVDSWPRVQERVRIVPPSLTAVQSPLESVVAGESLQLTMTLDSPAPANYLAELRLSDLAGQASKAATGPSSFRFALGTTSHTVTIKTYPVTTRTPVLAQAKVRGYGRQNRFAVLPAR